MSSFLRIGMTLYHRTNKTEAIISGLDETNITIELNKEIADKKELVLPVTHMGEWLFYKKEEIEAKPEKLIKMPEYLMYGNKLLQECLESAIEKKRINDIEEIRKNIEVSKQIRLKEDVKLKQLKEGEILVTQLKEKHQFDGFHHYTDFSNFIMIMKSGKLLCRNKAAEAGFTDAANQEVISRTENKIKDYVRFYYAGKTPTLYMNEGINVNNEAPHMPIPVLLLFKEDIIYSDGVAFLSGSGGNPHSKLTTDISEAMEFDWDMIFFRGPIPRRENTVGHVGNETSGAIITNKKNAEFLYPLELSLKQFKQIVFRSPADMKHAISLMGENSLFKVDDAEMKFLFRHVFLHNYFITYDNGKLLIALHFNKPSGNYCHKLLISYSDNTSEVINFETLDNSRKADLNKPSQYKNYDYYFQLEVLKGKIVIGVEYMMNEHVSAVWRAN